MKAPTTYAPWIVYGLIVLILGVLVAAHVPAPPTFVAARDLARNHRIVPDDLRLAGGYHRFFGPASPAIEDFAGRYLASSRAAGTTLGPSDAVARPQLTPPAGAFPLWLPLADVAEVDRDELDAGSAVDVCGVPSTKACLKHLAVAAVVCGTEKPSPCFVGVWAPLAQREAIYSALDKAGAPSPRVLPIETGGNP